MRSLFLFFLLTYSLGLWAQSSSVPAGSSTGSSSPDSQTPNSNSKPSQSPKSSNPDLTPPRSDSVNVNALDDTPGESSSKDNQIDLSPPKNDARAHPNSSNLVTDSASEDVNINEVHPWDPHKAMKDIEVGDFYFKQKNYVGAESRYREALYYKDNDALATFRLAECLEKMDRPDDALQEYESYLRILPNGPKAEKAKKAIERLKDPTANAKPAK
jgi:tetratricopeptide (TPR) repeat protein